MKRILNRILQRLKRDPDYALDPDLSGSDLAAMLAKMSRAWLRMLWWRPRFKRVVGIGFLDPSALIRNPGHISLGRSVVIEGDCEIQGLSRRGVSLGDQVTVGRLAMVRPSGYYGRELGEGLKVGARSNLGPYAYIGCGGFVEIGQDVMMGPRVSIIAEQHNFEDTTRSLRSQGVTRRGIVIEDNCWLGANCVILDGVRIGAGSVIAAGCVVTRSVPPNSIVAGVPGRVLRERGRS